MLHPSAYIRNGFVATTNHRRGHHHQTSNHQLSMSEPMAQAPVGYAPERAISQHLYDNGQSVQWLAGKLQLSRPFLSQVLRGEGINKRRLTPDLRARINQILKTNY